MQGFATDLKALTAVKYNVSRDLTIFNGQEAGAGNRQRFLSLDIPIKSFTVYYVPSLNRGIFGLKANLKDGSSSEILGKGIEHRGDMASKEILLEEQIYQVGS